MEIFIRWGWELLEALINGKETDVQRSLFPRKESRGLSDFWGMQNVCTDPYRSALTDWRRRLCADGTARRCTGVAAKAVIVHGVRNLALLSAKSQHSRVFECRWQVSGKLWPDLIIFVITWSMGVKPSHILQLMWPLTILICLNWSLSFISLISRTILVSPLVVYLVFLHEKISGHLSP